MAEEAKLMTGAFQYQSMAASKSYSYTSDYKKGSAKGQNQIVAGMGAQTYQNKQEPKKQWRRKDQAQPVQMVPLQKSQSEYVAQNASKKKQKFKYHNEDVYDYEQSEQLSKQPMQIQKQSANYLLGFQYQEEEQPASGLVYGQQQRLGRRANRRKNHRTYYKDYSVMSAFQLIVKRDKDYILNLYDGNENVDWKDVVQVIVNMHNAKDVQCPICMENLAQMAVAKITKCGHIYCWSCILQYLGYKKEANWKKCPLCSENVYPNDLKNVQVVQNNHFSEGTAIQFNLMVRFKDNTIVKDKSVGGDNSKLPAVKFPVENQLQFSRTRLLLSDQANELSTLNTDLLDLEEEMREHQSSQEYEKIPYIQEAIESCMKAIKICENPIFADESQGKSEMDFQEKKRIHNKKAGIKKAEMEEADETADDCYYFYQASTGENLFLHPLCYKIFQNQYDDYKFYPRQIQSQIVEINQAIADQDDQEFSKVKYLNHLPDGALYSFVEIDMQALVDDQVFKEFEKQVNYRERQRQKKKERDDIYTGKVNTIQQERFEKIKRDTVNLINTQSVSLKPCVVRNILYDEDRRRLSQNEETKIEIEEEKEESQNLQSEKKLWMELDSLLSKDSKQAQQLRKDVLEGVELSSAAKKQLMKKDEDDFECKEDNGFKFASSITIMEAKQKKRKRKR